MTEQNVRLHGTPPYTIAVLHGGPGLPGSVAPLARELARDWGVLEPFQTRPSVEGQIQELRTLLLEEVPLPSTLIGWSWGAMLGFMFAGRFPDMVKKLILVGSGVYDARSATTILETRLARLNQAEQQEARSLLAALSEPHTRATDPRSSRLGTLLQKTDNYDAVPEAEATSAFQHEIYRHVWSEAKEFRRSGQLLELGKHIRCPVVAIHGDYDPHPAEGVYQPLSTVLEDFRFIQLARCGHSPWLERHASDEFYRLLRDVLRQ